MSCANEGSLGVALPAALSAGGTALPGELEGLRGGREWGEREREKEIGLWGPRSPMVCHIPAGEPGKRVVTLLLPSCSIQGHSDLNDAHLHW